MRVFSWRSSRPAACVLAGLLLMSCVMCGGGKAPPPGASSPPATSPAPTRSATSLPSLAGTWNQLPSPPKALSEGAQGVFTDRDLVVWDPLGTGGGTGFAYRESDRRWRSISKGAVLGGSDFVMAWTGKVVVVWGGRSANSSRETTKGSRYNPATNTWRAMSKGPLTSTRAEAVWTGKVLIFVGTRGDGPREAPELAFYDPQSDRWGTIPAGSLGVRNSASVVWSGTEVLIWGGSKGGYQTSSGMQPVSFATDGAAWNPETKTWRTLATAPIAGRIYQVSAWDGNEMIVWGGADRSRKFSDGAAYDPKANQWRPIAAAPFAARSVSGTWTGRELIVWGGLVTDPTDETTEIATARGAYYRPAEDAWGPLPTSPLKPRVGNISAWTGSQALYLGGCCIRDEDSYQDGASLKTA
jgi:N-acetylneuraminic acid mutarotase